MHTAHLHHGVCHEPGCQAADCCPHRRALPFEAPTAGGLHLQKGTGGGVRSARVHLTEAEMCLAPRTACRSCMHSRADKVHAAHALPAVTASCLDCMQHAERRNLTSCDDHATAAAAALVSPGCPEVPSSLLGEGWSCACESCGAGLGPAGCSAWRRAGCPCLAPFEMTPAPWAALVHLHKTVGWAERLVCAAETLTQCSMAHEPTRSTLKNDRHGPDKQCNGKRCAAGWWRRGGLVDACLQETMCQAAAEAASCTCPNLHQFRGLLQALLRVRGKAASASWAGCVEAVPAATLRQYRQRTPLISAPAWTPAPDRPRDTAFPDCLRLLRCQLL